MEHHNKIASVHTLIYKKGYVIDTAQVEAKLKDEFLASTVVSIILKIDLKYNSKDVLARMCFQTGWIIQALIAFLYLL